MSRFKGTGKIQAAGTRLPFFQDPTEEEPSFQYVVQLTQLNVVSSAQVGKADSFILNARIVESNAPNDPPGHERAMVMKEDKGEIAYAWLKAILAACGIEREALMGADGEATLEAYIVESPARIHEDLDGHPLRVYVTRTTSVKGQSYGRASFSAIENDELQRLTDAGLLK